jgi:hypothetical protein
MDSWRVFRVVTLRGDVCVDTNFVRWSVLCTIRAYDLSFSPSNIVIVGRMEVSLIR